MPLKEKNKKICLSNEVLLLFCQRRGRKKNKDEEEGGEGGDEGHDLGMAGGLGVAGRFGAGQGLEHGGVSLADFFACAAASWRSVT